MVRLKREKKKILQRQNTCSFFTDTMSYSDTFICIPSPLSEYWDRLFEISFKHTYDESKFKQKCLKSS